MYVLMVPNLVNRVISPHSSPFNILVGDAKYNTLIHNIFMLNQSTLKLTNMKCIINYVTVDV